MTSLDIAQLGIAIFGSISFLLILCEGKTQQKWGTALGLFSCPFWWTMAIVTNQWMTYPVHLLYTLGWLWKAYKLWLKKDAKVADVEADVAPRKRLGQLPRTLEDAEEILAEYEAEVLYNDDVVVSMWYLTWQHGFMGQGYGYQDKEKAFVRAATFVVLWSAGFDTSSSDHLAAHWAAKETTNVET